jgi:hypothetical protein
MIKKMKPFSIFLQESKNVHLTHLEDEMFDKGSQGLLTAIRFITSVAKMLATSSNKSVKVTTKWDGAPAIVCGKDPETGKFFVGTKSVFNKVGPKINYTVADINKNHEGALAEKLKTALQHLSKLNFNEILQGDLLFTDDSVSMQEIQGENCLTFRPNTITYAVPVDSDFAKKIQKAKMGIVFHTKYTGPSIADSSASFDVDISKLKSNPNVWVTDAFFKDVSGIATFTKEETKQIAVKIKSIRSLMDSQTKNLLNKLSSSELLPYMHMYFNANVKVGSTIGDVKSHVDGLINFVKQKFQVEIDKLKTEKSKIDKTSKLENLIHFVESSRENLYKLYEIQKLIIDCKLMLISKLKKTKTVGTFIQTGDGFKVTDPEGFVAVSNDNTALKLVDRLEFSKLNFTVAKNWG